MHRPLIALAGALAITAPLVACTDNDPDAGAAGPISVVSTSL